MALELVWVAVDCDIYAEPLAERITNFCPKFSEGLLKLVSPCNLKPILQNQATKDMPSKPKLGIESWDADPKRLLYEWAGGRGEAQIWYEASSGDRGFRRVTSCDLSAGILAIGVVLTPVLTEGC